MSTDRQPSHLVRPEVEIAGLESSIGHLSRLVDFQRELLVEVEEVFGRDGHGGPFEDGEMPLIDEIRKHLGATVQNHVEDSRRVAKLREALERIAFYGLDPASEGGIDDSTLMHHFRGAAFTMVNIAARALEAAK